MDFTLRCNTLKCRRALTDRAVVTTCSHIFCIDCSNTLGFTNSINDERICPACNTPLPNKDDAAETQVSPSEDYKTSVLSGLAPSVIMECAGRGLSFYSYQVTQEVIYQEYLAKSLTDKHSVLNSQMDQIINDANTEILSLRNKISTLEIDQEDLRKKNHELFEAYNQKSQAHQKSQKMYDTLKKRTLQTDVRSYAEDAVEETLYNAAKERLSQNGTGLSGSQRQRPQYPVDHRGVEQLHSRQRSGSSGEGEQTGRVFDKPRAVYGQAWNPGNMGSAIGSTPARQRTRLPVAATPQTERHSQFIGGSQRTEFHNSLSQSSSQLTRQPLGALSHNTLSHNQTRYGMGAGAKLGDLHRSQSRAQPFPSRHL